MSCMYALANHPRIDAVRPSFRRYVMHRIAARGVAAPGLLASTQMHTKNNVRAFALSWLTATGRKVAGPTAQIVLRNSAGEPNHHPRR